MFFRLIIITIIRLFYTERSLLFALLLVLFAIFARFIIAFLNMGWIFIAIVLIFLGGIIVVFIYASSLSITKKHIWRFDIKKYVTRFIFLFLMIICYIVFFMKRINTRPRSLYANRAVINIIFIASYLLLALLLLVKIIRITEGPLKL